MANMTDNWVAASLYEDFMGRWSRLLATEFVSWLCIPHGAHWLDVGCGTGALTTAICIHGNAASVLGCDPAEPFIGFAKSHGSDNRITFVTAGVGNLPRRPEGYDSVTSLLALNFFPDPEAATREMISATAQEGTVSACVWDYGAGMEFLRYFWDVATAVDSSASAFDEGMRFPLCQPDSLTALFRSAKLANVRCDAIEIPTIFTNFLDYWQPFLGGIGPAPSYVASLDAEQRAALSQRLEEKLPLQTDGSIALTARAWALRGTVAE